jgi:hypothetical protein
LHSVSVASIWQAVSVIMIDTAAFEYQL